MEDHIKHVDTFLQILENNQLYVKISKCSFEKQVDYFGHIVSREGVKVDPLKIQDITKWLIPKNIKSLRGFLGLTRYYKNFVKNYACIADQFTSLLKKNSFVWNEEATLTLSLLKYVMSSTLILATHFGKTFIVKCDAYGQVIGATLTQEERPLDFESKQLKGKYSVKYTYEKEMTTILHAIKKWQQYFIGRNFKFKTVHDSLKNFLNQRLSSEEQQKWVAKMQGFDFEIIKKRGREMWLQILFPEWKKPQFCIPLHLPFLRG
jgi:hypothetical protein